MKSSLSRQLGALVAEYGIIAVEKALTKIGVSNVTILLNDANSKSRSGTTKKARRRRPINENPHVRRACKNRPDAVCVLEKLGTMFQERAFLEYLRDLRIFLHDHGCTDLPESRPDGLKQVMAVLSAMPLDELEEILREAEHRHKIGDFMMLANAIMGLPDE
jgi:hypothetical protein